MTRKKFVKQCMAVGIQRNTAESLAYWLQGSMHGYAVHLPYILERHRVLSAATDQDDRGGARHD